MGELNTGVCHKGKHTSKNEKHEISLAATGTRTEPEYQPYSPWS